MSVQQAEQAKDRSHRLRLTAFVSGKRIVATTGQFGRFVLGQSELAADPTQLRTGFLANTCVEGALKLTHFGP